MTYIELCGLIYLIFMHSIKWQLDLGKEGRNERIRKTRWKQKPVSYRVLWFVTQNWMLFVSEYHSEKWGLIGFCWCVEPASYYSYWNYYLKKKIDNLDLEYGKAAADRLSIWIEKLRLAYNSSFPSTNCFCSFGCLASNSCRSVSFLYFLSRPVEFIMAEFKNYGHAIGSLNILRIQLTNIQNDDYHLFQRNATALRFSHIYAEERRGYWRVSDTIIFDLRV